MNDNSISRRVFTRKVLGTALSVSFLGTLFSGCNRSNGIVIPETNNIIESKASEILNHWAIELNEICGDLRTQKISQMVW